MYCQLYHSEILCSTHNAFMCFAWILEQTAIISLHSINLPVFITDAERVYCAVQTRSSNQRDSFILKWLNFHTVLCLLVNSCDRKRLKRQDKESQNQYLQHHSSKHNFLLTVWCNSKKSFVFMHDS